MSKREWDVRGRVGTAGVSGGICAYAIVLAAFAKDVATVIVEGAWLGMAA